MDESPESAGFSHTEYQEERKELNKYQQVAYDSYERTLTTLSGFFFTLTTALLAYFSKGGGGSVDGRQPFDRGYLMISLSLFFASLALLLSCFFVNAASFTFEIDRLGRAQSKLDALNEVNYWALASKVFYALTLILFLGGMGGLLAFASVNLGR